MTTQQMRELDAWIAEHVFGITGQDGIKISESRAAINRINMDTSFPDCIAEDIAIGEAMPQFPYYTTDPAAAMEVLKKCYERAEFFESGYDESEGWWYFYDSALYAINSQSHESIELAICLFAKKLFSK